MDLIQPKCLFTNILLTYVFIIKIYCEKPMLPVNREYRRSVVNFNQKLRSNLKNYTELYKVLTHYCEN